MRRSVMFATVVAGVAVVAPLALSVYLASRESLNVEKDRVSGYAQDVLRRSEEAGTQMHQAFDLLRKAKYPPCSAAEIDLMRRLDIGSSYIQAVGRIGGDHLTCTSLGTQTPIEVGKPEAVSSLGVTDRLNRRLSDISADRMDVFSQDGFAVIIDQALIFDTPLEARDVQMALFMPSSPPDKTVVVGATVGVPQEFLKRIAPGARESYVRDGRIVSSMRSSKFDLEAVAAEPLSYANRRVAQFAMVRVPLGLVGGALLAWAVMYIARVRFSLASVLRAAARRHEFFLEYQPVVELETGRWVGAEALVRWKRNGRTVPPDQFIPVAEEQGAIVAITGEVIDMVARDLPGLRAIDPDFDVGVNLSAADMRSEETLARLERLLVVSGAEVHNVVVEATERGFLQGEESKRVLEAIRARGFTISIDDFGTGYSSLAALQSLSLDTLKIDKGFVDTIGTDGPTSEVVVHIIEMAKSMGLEIVAEGVETQPQAEFLRSRGVQYAQGWLFSRPIGVGEMKRKLRERKLVMTGV